MSGPQASGMGSAWAEAFLEMMSVERAAAKNTLTAYGRDLADAQGFLAGRGRDLADASAEDVEAYFTALGARVPMPPVAPPGMPQMPQMMPPGMPMPPQPMPPQMAPLQMPQMQPMQMPPVPFTPTLIEWDPVTYDVAAL